MNDPDFVPDMRLPKFDLEALVARSQQTNKTNSQMSPLGSTILSGSQSPGPGFNIHLDLNHSDSPGRRGSLLGLQGLSSAQKPEADPLILFEDDDEFAGSGDWGMDIDEEGNVTELAEPAIVQDEPDLPRLPAVEQENQAQPNQDQQDQPIMDDQGDIVMVDEAQPEAERLQAQQRSDGHNPFAPDDQPRAIPSRRKRKPRALPVDEETQIPRSIIHKWQGDYLKNCGVKAARPSTAGQTKANAMLLTFGLGLGNVGQNLGVPGMVHPLALDFSGDSLFTALTGLDVPEQPRGRRRSASESIEDDERRVRPRLESDFDQQGRGIQSDDVFGQDAPGLQDSPEVGREAQAPMSDHLSSALQMPWNRGSSLIPGSSIRGSAQKGRIPSSPLAHRGGNIQDLAHYSDGPSLADDGGFDMDMGAPPSQDDPFDGFNLANLAPEPKKEPEPAALKEGEWPSLDIEGANFLSYIESAVGENGERRQDEDYDVDRRWVAFDDVFVPKETDRLTAAQAFYHALSLASKGKLEVQQDGEANEPFGAIWVGLRKGGVSGGGVVAGKA
ncbi:hypothetical protein M434DRAFT_395850 [Hypoxylon sp. CO27-5]|nr:hypothetical protein M434DRAFT_395850 [Hypoxylon sp. CO27-5]